MSSALIGAFVSAGLLASVAFAATQDPAPSSKAPTTLTLTGCVSAKPEASGQYTFAEADGLREYRLKGKGINKFAGQRVELEGGTSNGLSIRTGLWPAPSGGARGVAQDPAQASVARQRGGSQSGSQFQELQVKRLRAIEGTCE